MIIRRQNFPQVNNIAHIENEKNWTEILCVLCVLHIGVVDGVAWCHFYSVYVCLPHGVRFTFYVIVTGQVVYFKIYILFCVYTKLSAYFFMQRSTIVLFVVPPV